MLLYRVDLNIAYCHRPQVEQVTVFCSDGDLPFEQSAPLCFLECASGTGFLVGLPVSVGHRSLSCLSEAGRSPGNT